MPIRFVDRAATIVGRVTTTLAEAAANFDGTFTAAAARTGSIVSQLQDMAGALQGLFQANANRVGTIASTLSDHTAAFRPPANTSLLEADWQSRISGSGVSWMHDFRNAAEVNQFRYANDYGHDPNDVARPNQTVWLSVDGITGGCMESRHIGTQNPPDWWRPMAPLNAASNGRGVNDPAVSGTLTLRSYTPNPAGGDTAHNSLNSVNYYGHSSYHAGSPGSFVGTSYFLQMRCKISANRPFVGSGPQGDEGGKLLYFTRTSNSNTSQELVTNSYVEVGSFGTGRNLFSMYRSGSPPIASDAAVSGLRQIGGEYNGGVCRSSPTVDSSGCWFWPTDETSPGAGRYVTLLYQIIPGTDGGDDTIVRVWKAEWGETSYTKIWDQSDVDLPFGVGFPFGHNAIICSGYQNNISFSEPVWHRYAQLIFSHNLIHPPQVYDTSSNALIVSAASLSAGQSATTIGGVSGVGLTSAALGSIQWVNRFFYHHERRSAYLFGKYQNNVNNGQRHLMVYGANANSWTSSSGFEIGGDEAGHIYESVAFDPATATLYTGRWNTNFIYRWTVGDALESWTQVAEYGSHWAQTGAPVNRPMAWHPNLFGVGDGGLVIWRNISQSVDMELLTWRKRTGTFHSITGTQFNATADTNASTCEYVRAYDAVFASHANGNTYRINAGSAGVLASPVQITNPPIRCTYIGGGSSGGILIDDPRGLGGPYILAKGTGNGSVWKYENGAWVAKTYTHPFPTAAAGNGTLWAVASCYPLGVFKCRPGSTSALPILWRPND
jgi:hypothetical protein